MSRTASQTGSQASAAKLADALAETLADTRTATGLVPPPSHDDEQQPGIAVPLDTDDDVKSLLGPPEDAKSLLGPPEPAARVGIDVRTLALGGAPAQSSRKGWCAGGGCFAISVSLLAGVLLLNLVVLDYFALIGRASSAIADADARRAEVSNEFAQLTQLKLARLSEQLSSVQLEVTKLSGEHGGAGDAVAREEKDETEVVATASSTGHASKIPTVIEEILTKLQEGTLDQKDRTSVATALKFIVWTPVLKGQPGFRGPHVKALLDGLREVRARHRTLDHVQHTHAG